MSFVGKMFTGLMAFTAGLNQNQTNGVSKWGTFQAPRIPKFIDRGSGQPWGSKNVTNANPYTDAPNTGVTVKFDFTVERHPMSPDGYTKDVLLVNGQFPGPLVEANWGDTIEVTLHNKISGPEEGTQIHFHGLTQKGTPFMDGVPAVTSCPIAPGDTFTYSFKADLYGTGWYHSHYSGQATGGLMGPVVIHGPSALDYDIDLGPVMVSEWYHKDYLELIDDVVGTDPSLWEPLADNNMINGKMNYDCSLVQDGTPCVSNAGLSQFNFTHGKTHRLRLVNGGSSSLQHFSIDGHEMTVIANDFVPVQPYKTNVVTLAVGQRTDVIVNATGAINGAYWMRSTISESPACSFTKQHKALAVVYYNHAPHTAKPNSTEWPQPDSCENDQTTPLYPIPADPNPTATISMDFAHTTNATGHQLWTVNDSAFRANYNHPVLPLAAAGNTSYAPEWNVYTLAGTHGTARIVMYNNSTMAHPMHLHGHNAQVLSAASGPWDGHSIASPSNPLRRDVYVIPPNGHLVIQFPLDNPGAWPLHCHVTWHLSTGMFASVMERVREVGAVPAAVGRVCGAWEAWQARGNVVDQVDSGV